MDVVGIEEGSARRVEDGQDSTGTAFSSTFTSFPSSL
jgi:hypothetical protein